MGNLMISIKRFLGNKNTVTIIGVVVGVIAIYIGYTWRVKQAVDPQKVPYAKVEILGNTAITREMVSTIEVSKKFVNQTPNLVTSLNQVIGKYVSYDTKISEGGLFYKDQLMAREQLPSYITEDLPEGYTVYSLPVTMHTTYANSIMPDDYIDLYISANSDDGKVIVAKMIQSIKVRDVRDNNGKSVFSSMSTSKVPSEIIFAVPDNMFLLLTRADKISSNNINIFPVPRGKDYVPKDASSELVASNSLKELINSKSDLSYDD